MPTKSRTKTQAAKQRQAIKKLRELGILSKRTDLRKAPSKHVLSQVRKYDDVLKGRAKVLQPKDPKSYKGLFRVKGKNVIVPRRKGEKITLTKTGEVRTSRKVGGLKVKSTYRRTDAAKNIPRAEKEGVQYAIPFHQFGSDEPMWQRFPTYDLLQKFMAQYEPPQGTYKRWWDYVVEEEIGDELSDDELSDRLRKRGKRLRRKIKPKKRKRTRRKV